MRLNENMGIAKSLFVCEAANYSRDTLCYINEGLQCCAGECLFVGGGLEF